MKLKLGGRLLCSSAKTEFDLWFSNLVDCTVLKFQIFFVNNRYLSIGILIKEMSINQFACLNNSMEGRLEQRYCRNINSATPIREEDHGRHAGHRSVPLQPQPANILQKSVPKVSKSATDFLYHFWMFFGSFGSLSCWIQTDFSHPLSKMDKVFSISIIYHLFSP